MCSRPPAAAILPQFASDHGDPNGQPAGFVGFGLNNLLNNKLTVLALSHIGPEQPPGSILPTGAILSGDPYGYKSDLRYYNDVVFTYKFNDDVTGVLEGNYTHDDFGYGPSAGGPADFYSGVAYLGYTFDKIYTLNGRAEMPATPRTSSSRTPLVNSGIATRRGRVSGLQPQRLRRQGYDLQRLHRRHHDQARRAEAARHSHAAPRGSLRLHPRRRPRSTARDSSSGATSVTFGGDVIVGF